MDHNYSRDFRFTEDNFEVRVSPIQEVVYNMIEFFAENLDESCDDDTKDFDLLHYIDNLLIENGDPFCIETPIEGRKVEKIALEAIEKYDKMKKDFKTTEKFDLLTKALRNSKTEKSRSETLLRRGLLCKDENDLESALENFELVDVEVLQTLQP